MRSLPKLALLRLGDRGGGCPLPGEDQKSDFGAGKTAVDPTRTFGLRLPEMRAQSAVEWRRNIRPFDRLTLSLSSPLVRIQGETTDIRESGGYGR